MLLFCDVSVDRQAYDYVDRDWNQYDITGVYPPLDYDTSTIRTWLNEIFYEWAFTATEKSRVLSTQVPQYDADGTKYSENKVFLLSENDLLDSAFGLNEQLPLYLKFDEGISYVTYGYPALEKTATDYAKLYEKHAGCNVLYRDNDGSWPGVCCYQALFDGGDWYYPWVNFLHDIVPMIVISK